jgi:hypothetical protein
MSDETVQDTRAVVRTHRVKVKAFVRNGAVIEGNAHIKPGAYQRRVSDVLNLGKMKYIAITDVQYSPPNGDSVTTECVLVNVEDIVMLDVTPDEIPAAPQD